VGPAPQVIGAPEVPPEESKDVHHETADVPEVVERAQDPAPSATPSGATVQSIAGIIQPQPAGHPPPGQ
jgi:hypothetical protein